MTKLNITTLENPKSYISEAYKTLRTNIQFSFCEKKINTIMVTSSEPDEGKTTIVTNLAVTMAQAGSKTIILDCDMRNPKVHRAFKISNSLGLSDLLIGVSSVEEAVQKTEIEELYILTAGTRPPNPSELLSSNKMQELLENIKKNFDYVIIDTPPVLIVTDAQIVSKYADGSVIVAAAGETTRESIVRSKELLNKVNAKILGTVLNKANQSKRSYYEKGISKYYGSTRKKSRGKKKYKRIREKIKS